MFAGLISWFFFLLVLKGDDVDSSSPRCDSKLSNVGEGVLGQTRTFPWIGVLRVHLHEGQSFKVALTGIVLVKEGYAIANADDVYRVPKRIFQEDSRAMFIPEDNEPWFCKVLDYMTHPEFEFETMNTIALIELDLEDVRFSPMPPICWPGYSFNASDQLYVAGYTDENKLLEKLTYRVQYVNLTICKEFYNRAGLTEGNMAPTQYLCGFAQNNKDNCVWDNGMALVSNASGYWTLIGMSIHGPGCAAPARFIDLLPYYQWIDSATNLQELDDYASYRRSAFDNGFKPRKKPVSDNEDIPLHDLLRSSNLGHPTNYSITDIMDRVDDPLNKVSGKHVFAHYYRVPPTDMEDMFSIERINRTEIQLTRITNGIHGNCTSRSNRLIYKDYFKINMPMVRRPSPVQWDRGIVTYRLSMFDLYFLNYTCVKLKVHSTRPEEAYIWYAQDIDQLEGIGSPDNPEEIIRLYPITPHPFLTTTSKHRRPGVFMRPKPNEDIVPRYYVHNLNLFIRIHFLLEGRIEVKIFGPYVGLTSSTTRGTTTTPPMTVSTQDPYLLEDFPPNLRSQDPSSESVEDVEAALMKDEVVADEVEVDEEDVDDNSGTNLRVDIGLVIFLFLVAVRE